MKTYRKERKEYLNRVDHARKKRKLHICVLGAVSVAVVGFSVAFTIDLKIEDAHAAKKYVKNYSDQRENMLDIEIDSGKLTLNGLKEYIEKSDIHTNLEGLLEEKRAEHDLEFIMLYDADNGDITQVGSLPEGLDTDTIKKDMLAQSGLEDGECAVSFDKQSLIYTTNLFKSSGKSNIFLAMGNTKKIRKLIEENSSECKNFIVDEEYQIVFSSRLSEDSQMWKYLFNQNKSEDLSKSVEQMKHNLKSGKSDVFKIHSYENREYYLAYSPTETKDWSVITIVPAGLFTGFSDEYVLGMLGSLVGTLILLGVYFILLFRNYEKNEKKLEELAFEDHVTGGINRTEFRIRYKKLCRKKVEDQYAIVLMDPVDFKRINEMLGVAKGDEILRGFYKIIEASLRKEDEEFASRTEMDHIFLCLRERDPKRIQNRMDQIIEKINDFQASELPQCKIAIRLGVSFVKKKETEITTIQDRARLLLKRKSNIKEGVCVFFDSEVERQIEKERELERLFESAIAAEEFQVYIQPQVNLKKRKITGAEALVRWQRPDVGIIPPNEFIPILESNGKIRILDQYVFEKVCKWLKKRKTEGKVLIPIAVNLSRMHFICGNFVDKFAAIADKYEVDKKLIEFELTETIFLNETDVGKVKEGIQSMHKYGFRCALDDFGTGFSSLIFLKEFEIDVLKMDRSFFTDLKSQAALDLIGSIAELAKKLDIASVAEGIETEEQIKLLKNLKCEVVQGYYFSKPLPIEQFEKWIEEFENMDILKKNDQYENKLTEEYIQGGYTEYEITGTGQTIL